MLKHNAETTERETYSVEQAARVLGVGRNTLYEAVRAGRVRVLELPGSRWRVPRREIDRLLAGASAAA
jgi:excisionase family DNA binding protein